MSEFDQRDLELTADDIYNLWQLVHHTDGLDLTGTLEFNPPSKHDGPRVRCLVHQGVAVFTNDEPVFPEYRSA